MNMKIAIVSAFYSEGMGYTENCLPKFLSMMGHEVHVITSTYNVYGNDPDYDKTYSSFLGHREQPVGTFQSNGYSVHRLATRLISGYVWLPGLRRMIEQLKPDIVHSLEHGSILTFWLAALKPRYGFGLFTESHQHLSVVKPYLLDPGVSLHKFAYWLTRTLPGRLASFATDTCFAIAPDCAEVAERYFGVPHHMIKMQSLGSDTDLFRPPSSEMDFREREANRARVGCTGDEILCVYTGRFSPSKNPALLAEALQHLAEAGVPVRGVFVGEGPQRREIERVPNCKILPFMRHAELAQVYRAADIAVWPREESMSMLDAASSGLPIVASDRLGESERLQGSGYAYRENDVISLADTIKLLIDPNLRTVLGTAGALKMRQSFNWATVAETVFAAYERHLAGKDAHK